MIITTTTEIAGKKVEKTLGLVYGFGGWGFGSSEYEALKGALAAMTKQAEEMGANAIIGAGLLCSMVAGEDAEKLITVYGTAVVVE